MVGYLCAHHLWKQVPVVAVNLRREIVHTEHVVCTVSQDTGTIWSPRLGEEERGVCLIKMVFAAL